MLLTILKFEGVIVGVGNFIVLRNPKFGALIVFEITAFIRMDR